MTNGVNPGQKSKPVALEWLTHATEYEAYGWGARPRVRTHCPFGARNDVEGSESHTKEGPAPRVEREPRAQQKGIHNGGTAKTKNNGVSHQNRCPQGAK